MRSVHLQIGLVALATVTLASGRAVAVADPAIKCRQAIVTGAARLADVQLAVLRKCEEAKRRGKLPTVPSCRDESGVAAALAKVQRKLAVTVDRACGGADKRCGGADDIGLAAIAWPAICPELEGSGCAAPLASCVDVVACVACLADAAVTRGVALVYEPFAVADPKSQKATVRCQKALASAATALVDTRLAANARCLTTRLSGKHAAPCPVPGDGKTAGALTKARVKAEASVCKACGGADRACGGGDDLFRELVGIAPGCPGIGVCDTRIASLTDLLACFECSGAARADCALAGAAPGIVEYPPACAVVPPTPTPTLTPSASPTFTPSPTLTPSASPTFTRSPTPTPRASPTFTRSPTPSATPIFCRRDPARTSAVTITIATGGPPLGGANMILDYDSVRVRMDGAGDDPAVRNAVADLTDGVLVNKGSPNNQDTDADMTPDRLRFVLVAQNGVVGAILRVTFGLCVGTTATLPEHYACTLEFARATDGVTRLPGAVCTVTVANGGP